MNAHLDEASELASPVAREAVLGLLGDFDRVFGVLRLRDRERTSVEAGERRWIEERVEAREEARREGAYERADAIRDELEERGVVLEDTPEGTRWKVEDASLLELGTSGGTRGD